MMMVRRAPAALPVGAICPRCRLALARSPVYPVQGPFVSRRPTFSSQSLRWLSRTPLFRHAKTGAADSPDQDAVAARTEAVQDGEAAHAAEQAAVPWYLRVEPPPGHAMTIEPPALPEIPPGSPDILASLLDYAAEEMGLDDLSLLDLRGLDPPSALGANLFMLFGSARSERHLNVSAGRLVRWLRANHRIHADAAGLLSPSERKIKLRRRARRAKLMGSTGTDDSDDGMSTGWICVNLGNINGSDEEAAMDRNDGGFAGFGPPASGYNIVVQVMTPPRRAEMDLETLWQRTLASGDSKPLPSPSSQAGHPADLHPLEKAILTSPSSRPTTRRNPSGQIPNAQWRFHATHANLRINSVERSHHALPETDPLVTTSLHDLDKMLVCDGAQKLRVLRMLNSWLSNASHDEQKKALGFSADGQADGSFDRLFSRALESLPAEQTWGARLDYLNVMRRHDHMLHDQCAQLADELAVLGVSPTRQQYIQLLSCIFCTTSEDPHRNADTALRVLETMYRRGEAIVAQDIVVGILQGVDAATNWKMADSERNSLWALQRRLEQLTLQAELPCMDEASLKTLMEIYWAQQDWGKFWDVWQMPPRFLRRRSEDLYVFLYHIVARTATKRLTADAVWAATRTLIADAVWKGAMDMLNERPPVLPVGAVGRAMMACIQVAEPEAATLAANPLVDFERGEFVKLVRFMNEHQQAHRFAATQAR